jgi:hypothetical protein
MRYRGTQTFRNFSEGYRSRCELPEGSDAEVALSLQRFFNARKRPSKSALTVVPVQKGNKLLWILLPAVFLLGAGVTLVGAFLAGRSSAVPIAIQPVHKPASDRVTFQVEIRGGGTSAASQIVPVVDGSKPRTDPGSPGRPRLRTRRTAKQSIRESRDQLKAKTMFQPTRALPRSLPNLQREIAARPPDIQLASDQNAASLPFGPADAPPEYSKPDRRTKFFKAIKHLILPSAKLRESFEP